jgi:RNA polymerase sigma-70 factor (ECF subfamily)
MDEAPYPELVRRIVAGGAGGREAEAELCRRFAPRIRLYGLRHLRDEERAADLVQTVLIATIEAVRANRVAEPEHLDRFVLGTCRNTTLRVRETDARSVVREPSELDLGAVEPNVGAVDLGALMRCITELEARARAVIALTFQEDYSGDEIAAALGTTSANVRVLRHRAVAHLRTCLERGGSP